MKYRKSNIVQSLIILILLVTNYFSYFHHEKFVLFILTTTNRIKDIYFEILENASAFIKWIYHQEYDFSFNNREIAFGIIILISGFWMIINKGVRKSLFGVLKALFNRHFNRVYIEIFIYTILMVVILYRLGFWEFIYMKATLVWVFLSALYLSFTVADSAIKNSSNIFITSFKQTVSVSVIVVFLLNIFTFPIIIEVILISFLILLAMMIAFTESYPDKDKNGQVNKLLNGINIFIGLNILAYLLIKVISNWGDLFTLDIFKAFFLPIMFTFMFIPYLYYLIIRLSYEQINVFIRLNKKVDKRTFLYYKFRLYLHCKLNRNKIIELKKHKSHLIRNIETKSDIDNIFF